MISKLHKTINRQHIHHKNTMINYLKTKTLCWKADSYLNIGNSRNTLSNFSYAACLSSSFSSSFAFKQSHGLFLFGKFEFLFSLHTLWKPQLNTNMISAVAFFRLDLSSCFTKRVVKQHHQWQYKICFLFPEPGPNPRKPLTAGQVRCDDVPHSIFPGC